MRSSTESMSGASRIASPAGHRLGGDQLEGLGVGGGAGDPLEVGQQPVLAEPDGVVGVVDQHRGPGRRPQHAGLGDPVADQRVHQRGLAGAGGAADHGQQRGVDGHQPRQHVVLELVDHLLPGRALLVDVRDLQRQRARPAAIRAGGPARSPSGCCRARLGRGRGGRGGVDCGAHRVGTTCPGKRSRGVRRRCGRRTPGRGRRSPGAACRAGSDGGGSRARWPPAGSRASPARAARPPYWRAWARLRRRAPRSTTQPMSVAGISPRPAASPRAAVSIRRSERRAQIARHTIATSAGRHQQQVDADEAVHAVDGRGVPGGVGDHRARRSRPAAPGSGPLRCARPRRCPTPMPVNVVNERVRERADEAAQHEGPGQRLRAAGTHAVGAVVGRREVEDVLGEREADARPCRRRRCRRGSRRARPAATTAAGSGRAPCWPPR